MGMVFLGSNSVYMDPLGFGSLRDTPQAGSAPVRRCRPCLQDASSYEGIGPVRALGHRLSDVFRRAQ